MIRQSISLTEPNNDWLKACVENEEYSSKSELVNDLIRQARHQQAEIDLMFRIRRSRKKWLYNSYKSRNFRAIKKPC